MSGSTQNVKKSFWRRHVLLVIGLVFVLSTLVLMRGVLSLKAYLSDAATVDVAAGYIQTFESFRSVYTAKVVEPAKQAGIEITHDYHQKEFALPLPATLTIEIGQYISEHSDRNIEVKLYSEYPFPWRKGTRELDAFDKEALAVLKNSPEQAYYRIEDQAGQRIMRYAKADKLRSSCVSCHNNHPQTPKSDWKVGDMRGVLSVSFPLSGFENEGTKAIHNIQFNLVFFLFLLGGVLYWLGHLVKNQ